MQKSDWSLSSIMALAFGLLTAWFWWWFILHEGAWPFIIFAWIPAIPALALGYYAIKVYDSRIGLLAVILALSPLATLILL